MVENTNSTLQNHPWLVREAVIESSDTPSDSSRYVDPELWALIQERERMVDLMSVESGADESDERRKYFAELQQAIVQRKRELDQNHPLD